MEETNKLSIFKTRQEKLPKDNIPLLETEPPISLSEKRTSISKIFAKQKIGTFSTDFNIPKKPNFIDKMLEKINRTSKSSSVDNTQEVPKNTQEVPKKVALRQTNLDLFFPSPKLFCSPDIKVVIENRQKNKKNFSKKPQTSFQSFKTLEKKLDHKDSEEDYSKLSKQLAELNNSRVFSNLCDEELTRNELNMRHETFRNLKNNNTKQTKEDVEEEKKRMVAKALKDKRREEAEKKKKKGAAQNFDSEKLAQERNRMLRLFRKTMGESSKTREKELEEMFKNREVLIPTDFNTFLDIQKLVEKKSCSELFRIILSFSSSKVNHNLKTNNKIYSAATPPPSSTLLCPPTSSHLSQLLPSSSLILPPQPSSDHAPPLPTIKLSTVFSSAHEYVDILKSLFFKEVRCQIENSIETTKKLQFKGGQNKKYRLQILNEKTYEIFSSLEIEEVGVLLPNKTEIYGENAKNIKKNDFSPLQGQGNLLDDFDIIYSKNYLVILTNIEEIKDFKLLEDKERKNPHHFMILGILLEEKVKANSKKIITLENSEKLSKYFVEKDAHAFVSLLPVDKLVTFQREFLAIQAFPLTNLINDVISPKKNSENPITEYYPSPYDAILPVLRESYNPSQFSAIKGALDSTENIVLLQGPPGTGKTHTLLGLVSAIYYKIHSASFAFDKKPKILICAPSNTAIDEIIFRLMNEGILNPAYKAKSNDIKNLKSKLDQQEVCELEDKIKIKPKLVRIGVLDKNPNEIIKSVSIENLAQKALDGDKGEERGKEEIRQKLFLLNKKLDEMKEKDSEEARKERNMILEQRRQLKWKMMECKKNKEIRREKYNQIVNQIMMEADIICSTLSSSGSDKLDFFKNRIETLIIDEASQATEPSNLIPFHVSPSKVILIGDPKQLPSTTFSPDAAQTNYNRSLFERLLLSGKEPFFLEIQYRMESNIREFASCAFYEGRLKDDEIIRKREWPDYLKSFKKGGGWEVGRGGKEEGEVVGKGGNSNNMLFVEVRTSKERQIDFSFRNEGEAKLALCLCEGILKQLEGFIRTRGQAQIGFISPYKAQIDYFRGLVRDQMRDKMGEIQINTVDSFQGQEKDVIILSTVRSGSELGFVKDLRRMNVALTRARFVLIVLGNSETLGGSEFWFKLLETYQKKQQCASLDNESLIFEFVDNLMNSPNSRPKKFYNFQLPFPRRTVKKFKISDHAELPVKKEIWTKPIPIDPNNIIYRIKKKETQSLLDEDNKKVQNNHMEKKKEVSQTEKSIEIELVSESNLPIKKQNFIQINDNKLEQKYDILGLPISENSSLSSLITGSTAKKKAIPKNNFLYDIT